MLHLLNNSALRNLTPCITAVQINISYLSPPHQSHISGLPLAIFRDSPQGQEHFQVTLLKFGRTGGRTCACKSHFCSADKAWQEASHHGRSACSQDMTTRHQLGQLYPHSPELLGRAFLQRPRNSSFAHCCSLKAFNRKHTKTFPVFASQDLELYAKDLPETLGP